MCAARSNAIPGRDAAASAVEGPPRVRPITVGDVRDALAKGVDDFRVMPRHLLFLAIIYPVVCLLAIGFTFNYSLLPLVFPLVAGFALLGPLSAIGLHELSRRREKGMDTRWWHMLDPIRSPSAGSLLVLGLGLVVVFLAWLGVALVIYRATFGDLPIDAPEFRDQLLTTGHGWALIVLGNGLGFVFALAVFAVTVVGMPMLVDRHVPLGTAVGASIRAVAANFAPMMAWAAIVVAGLVVGSIPLFVGLAVVLPILGHGTWHLYRKVIEA